MELENTPIFREVQAIIANGATSANVTWEVQIHYDPTKDPTKPLIVRAINTSRNYVENYTDDTRLTVVMGLGDYAHLIVPNRTTLEITLTKQTLKEGVDTLDPNVPAQSERFRAVLLNPQKSPTVGQGQEVNDRESLNLVQPVDVHFQIYDKAVEQLRVLMTGSIYRGCQLQDVVKHALTAACQTAKVSQERAYAGVDIIPFDNQDKKTQVIITDGTHVTDVVDFLQHRYGLYNADAGSYLQNKNWFVYPLYDTTDFQHRQRTLTLMILPKRKFTNIERTFEVKGTSVTVLIAGESGFKDDNGTQYINSGNGARFADASQLLSAPATVAGNKATFNRKTNNSEFLADTAVGVNNAPVVKNRITSNPFVAYSDLASKNGGLFQCVWQNSDPTILVPGMAAKIIYMDGSVVAEIYGIVHRTETVSMKVASYGNPRFQNQTVINVFVNGQVTPITT